jgi:hypothetical protein
MGRSLRLDIDNDVYDDLLILHVTSRRGRYRPKEFHVEKRHLLRIINIEGKRNERIDGSFEIDDRNGMFVQLLDKLNLKGLVNPIRKSWINYLDQLDWHVQSFVALDRTQEARKETEYLLKQLEKRDVKYKVIEEDRKAHINNSHVRSDFDKFDEDLEEEEEIDSSEYDERRLRRV